MTPEEHYEEVVKLDMDKFDKKMPKFDYYDLLDFADSYYKKQLTLTDVSHQRELCEGKCGMSYCDDNGCIDRKRNLVEPKDKPEHCG